ncbi:MAG: RNase adapter RapZ, partial [Syntrophobacteraceae bacterium]
GIDIRERKFLQNYNQIFSSLEDAGYRFEIIFLEADDEILQRRYSQTRRIHPAAPSGHQLLPAINLEREQLRALRGRATRIIDTGTLSVHELKRLITRLFSYTGEDEQLSVQILSFGYKYGVPLEADLVMDVRFLPNPYFIESLKNLDGSTAEVRSWVLERPAVQEFLSDYSSLLLKILPSYVQEGKRYLTIALGCTGGRHRSVVIAETIADRLKQDCYYVSVFHRDINLE